MAAKIEKTTIIGDVLDIAPETAPLFMAIGMHCLGCPSSRGEPMAKLLKSAVANAEHNHEMNTDNLYVSTVVANPGPILKRGRIASRRGFVRINKRTTHITIGVSEKA